MRALRASIAERFSMANRRSFYPRPQERARLGGDTDSGHAG
jgi:hypothetical protein